ncbi:MAG: hypothetical protein ACOCSR_05120 [Wenzhouxiangella sp.]
MRKVEHTRAFELPQPVSAVFPLFSPEGEKQWVPGWDYDNVMGTAQLCEDYVFLTQSHDHATDEAIWLVKRYEPVSHVVAFYKVEPGEKVGVVNVRCTSLAARRTRVEVSYKYIALSESGEAFIADFTAQVYAEFIREWQELLLEYFAETG